MLCALNIGRMMLSCVRQVREAHKAGIEVILDVVFNHTAEGNERGPYISFRYADPPRYWRAQV